MTNVIVVIGAGSIGQAIVRRVAVGKQVSYWLTSSRKTPM
jgi:predicted dinucleotide-binding enzyme